MVAGSYAAYAAHPGIVPPPAVEHARAVLRAEVLGLRTVP